MPTIMMGRAKRLHGSAAFKRRYGMDSPVDHCTPYRLIQADRETCIKIRDGKPDFTSQPVKTMKITKNENKIHRAATPRISKTGSISERDNEEFFKSLNFAGITHPGKQWLIGALDQFHHTELPRAPMPTGYDGKTVVRSIKLQLPIQSPYGTGVNYDVHVAWLPVALEPKDSDDDTEALWPAVGLDFDSNTQGVAQENSNIAGAGLVIENASSQGTMGRGGLVLYYRPSGQGTAAYRAGSFSGNNYDATNNDIHIDEAFLGPYLGTNSTMTRIVGGAFKVVNTTSALNKQGSVTCYRQGAQPLVDPYETLCSMSGVDGGLAFNWPRRGVTRLPCPPQTLAEATQLTSTTHEAAEGALIPIILDTSQTQFEKMRPVGVAMLGDYAAQADIGLDAWTGYCSRAESVDSYANPLPLVADGHDACSQLLHTNQCGAVFTGLSAETTMTVELRLSIEEAPKPWNRDVTLSYQAPPIDINALRAYDIFTSHMKAGYYADENSIGSFFRSVANDVVSVVHTLAAPAAAIATALGEPEIGAGIIAGSRVLKKIKPKAKPKAKSQRK